MHQSFYTIKNAVDGPVRLRAPERGNSLRVHIFQRRREGVDRAAQLNHQTQFGATEQDKPVSDRVESAEPA